jgi:hypothetical protein
MCNRKVQLPRDEILGWLKALPEQLQQQAEVFPLGLAVRWDDETYYTIGYFVDPDGLNVMITPVPLENLTCSSFQGAVNHSFPVGWSRLVKEQRLH